jgi:hypothetical protein
MYVDLKSRHLGISLFLDVGNKLPSFYSILLPLSSSRCYLIEKAQLKKYCLNLLEQVSVLRVDESSLSIAILTFHAFLS